MTLNKCAVKSYGSAKRYETFSVPEIDHNRRRSVGADAGQS